MGAVEAAAAGRVDGSAGGGGGQGAHAAGDAAARGGGLGGGRAHGGGGRGWTLRGWRRRRLPSGGGVCARGGGGGGAAAAAQVALALVLARARPRPLPRPPPAPGRARGGVRRPRGGGRVGDARGAARAAVRPFQLRVRLPRPPLPRADGRQAVGHAGDGDGAGPGPRPGAAAQPGAAPLVVGAAPLLAARARPAPASGRASSLGPAGPRAHLAARHAHGRGGAPPADRAVPLLHPRRGRLPARTHARPARLPPRSGQGVAARHAARLTATSLHAAAPLHAARGAAAARGGAQLLHEEACAAHASLPHGLAAAVADAWAADQPMPPPYSVAWLQGDELDPSLHTPGRLRRWVVDLRPEAEHKRGCFALTRHLPPAEATRPEAKRPEVREAVRAELREICDDGGVAPALLTSGDPRTDKGTPGLGAQLVREIVDEFLADGFANLGVLQGSGFHALSLEQRSAMLVSDDVAPDFSSPGQTDRLAGAKAAAERAKAEAAKAGEKLTRVFSFGRKPARSKAAGEGGTP
ncbi:hypothetical protein EMIHUDRAFT_466341 [Emiliania huxleyi CCMP1516]|uniref:Rhodanese domain-containing protein n=2 Tax=Emiliania huxleyi TaxID=2903 RepID=A0A0D3HXF7_EMIH1|nr:hypothetical protein EMIHUDRAFT_466341 [Emiliania huxleyi CCMP1516]EOD03692.1 hypothetical protein EMIHUDRAFT_466341 [Emiliania huxleyi CCMP1516]|eukprot:XP_005756121.1 hypothetical protein EMIHUDRAFT_466341 [Emiliania huxleyi CCMP1516]